MKRVAATVLLPLVIFSVASAQIPGVIGKRVLLANGWWLSPAGKSITLSTMPLNAAVSPDWKYLAVTNDGMRKPLLMLVNLQSRKVVQSISLKDSWLGIAFHGSRLYVSGGNQNCVYEFKLVGGHLINSDTIVFAPPHPKAFAFAAGLDVNDQYLAVVFRGDSTLRYYDLKSKKITTVKLDGMPYTCKFLKNGTLLVSMWSSKKIEAFDVENLLYEIPSGDHPTEIAVTRDNRTAFVANANDNSVTMMNLKDHKAIVDISTSLYPDSPEGSTPNSVCVSPDGKYILAANADNNSLTVIKVSGDKGMPIGFIPVGWYPTKVLDLNDGTILVLNGKGNRSYPNANHQYIGTMLSGTLSFFKFPGGGKLAAYTKEVYANTPYHPSELKRVAYDPNNPIPDKVGGNSPTYGRTVSPIKYVFYFIKENRTYDQVFGDMKRGNGDPSLVMFGEKITPNIHALARDYVLLDNLYANAEVSADGHNWSTAAYATDYVQKSWPNDYAGRGAPYEFEGGQPTASPTAGYIWNDCLAHGVSFRDYGEFVASNRDTAKANTPREKALDGHTDVMYRGWDLNYSDLSRYNTWNEDFTKLVREGKLPRLSILRLPNDHTAGTRKGELTPDAMVAQNDYALGLFVDRISHSRIWNRCAIFVIEDDAQDGADHVDCHRTEGLVISPYVKRNYVDNTFYTTSSMLRTMELILGLPPMSQYDAAANPMFNSFTMNVDTSSYSVISPEVDIHSKNPEGAYGQAIMDHWDFAHADRVPPRQFNEILWRAMKGTEMPTPRYTIFSGRGGA